MRPTYAPATTTGRNQPTEILSVISGHILRQRRGRICIAIHSLPICQDQWHRPWQWPIALRSYEKSGRDSASPKRNARWLLVSPSKHSARGMRADGRRQRPSCAGLKGSERKDRSPPSAVIILRSSALEYRAIGVSFNGLRGGQVRAIVACCSSRFSGPALCASAHCSQSSPTSPKPSSWLSRPPARLTVSLQHR